MFVKYNDADFALFTKKVKTQKTIEKNLLQS